jgi:hypothetical protein
MLYVSSSLPRDSSQPPAHACSTRCTTDTATTLDTMDGPPASVTSVFLGSPVVSPQPLPRSRLSCFSPQVPCVSGAPDHVSDDEVPIPCLHVTLPPRPAARAAATSPANSDDEVPIPRFSHRPALLSRCGDAEVSLLPSSVSRFHSSTSPPIQSAPQPGGRIRCPLGHG